jgi:hypothetical protein
MRDLLDIIKLIEEKEEGDVSSLKKAIAGLLKDTEEGSVLNQVLKVLQAGNIDERIAKVVGTDADAKQFITQITDAIIKSDASIQQKNEFLEKFPKGIIDANTMVDGGDHTFEELVGAGFPTELLKDLSVRLTSQGVGPGEVALAIMSPKIKWSGREVGGGDILVNGKPVEVKTRVSSGGRWLNTRKSNMNLPAIKQAIEEATGFDVPARLSVDNWVTVYRPNIDPKKLPEVAKIIADGVFNGVNNNAYKEMLMKGDTQDIIDEHLRTGYKNYKAVSGFEGLLLMDLPTERIQYFTDYDDMEGLIKNDSVYLYAPEAEMMPKVALAGGGKSKAEKGEVEKPTKSFGPETTEKDFLDKSAEIAGKATKAVKSIASTAASKMGDVGRKLRKV